MRLTRKQLERILVLLALDARINSVTIEETSTSGIGLSHRAILHRDDIERSYEADITDVDTW